VAKKWRKRKNRLARLRHPAPGSTDEMHQALGEFLTEMGRLEFRMLTYVDFLGGLYDPPLEALFDEYAKKTFEPKIEWFETCCEHYGVRPEHRLIMDEVYKNMRELLTKRNHIVHGERTGPLTGRSGHCVLRHFAPPAAAPAAPS